MSSPGRSSAACLFVRQKAGIDLRRVRLYNVYDRATNTAAEDVHNSFPAVAIGAAEAVESAQHIAFKIDVAAAIPKLMLPAWISTGRKHSPIW